MSLNSINSLNSVKLIGKNSIRSSLLSQTSQWSNFGLDPTRSFNVNWQTIWAISTTCCIFLLESILNIFRNDWKTSHDNWRITSLSNTFVVFAKQWYHCNYSIITACVRSTTGGYYRPCTCFHTCLPIHPSIPCQGVPHLRYPPLDLARGWLENESWQLANYLVVQYIRGFCKTMVSL